MARGNPIGQVDDFKQHIARESIRGGVSLVISEICCNIFRLVGTVVLARLLTPEHFGLIGMITAFTAIAEMFKDLGLGTATLQQKEITHEQISTLFWINTAVGAGIMLLLAMVSPLLSWFYADPRLLWVALAISTTFLFGGLTVQHQALLRRQMCFVRLGTIQVLSTAISTIIGISLAWFGFEYWALVWKEISRAIIQAGGVWLFSHWRPGAPQLGAGVRRMFQTGSHVTGFNVLAFMSRSLDQVLLGRIWGAASLGIYKQAGLLLSLPGSLFSFPITYVMTPALSALQGEPARYRQYYKGAVSFLAFVYIPVMGYFAVYADDIVTVILGQKWIACAAVIRILAFAACVETLASTSGVVMITFGRTKAYLMLGGFQAAFLGLAMCVGIQWGVIGIAIAYVVYTYSTLFPSLWSSFRNTPVSVRVFLEAVSRPVFCTIFMCSLMVLLRKFSQSLDPIVEIGCAALVAPACYLGMWICLPGGKDTLFRYYSHVFRALEVLPFFARAQKV